MFHITLSMQDQTYSEIHQFGKNDYFMSKIYGCLFPNLYKNMSFVMSFTW